MPNDELGYLAGVFDGEGTFGIWSKGKNKTRQLRVAVDMSDGDIVLRFLTFFKTGAIYARQPKNPKHKLMYSWRVTKKEKALDILRTMLPYLSKRRQLKFHEVANG
jgi:hypothetical protein|tara:strand:- start:11 stop:328 length:318 start_codon:yes stop_codon:yes gene_type:complete